MNGKAVKKAIPIDWFKVDTKTNISLLDWIRSFGDKPKDVIAYKEGKLKVLTIEGHSYDVPDGYIIIRGIKGEYYPIDPVVFEESYKVL